MCREFWLCVAVVLTLTACAGDRTECPPCPPAERAGEKPNDRADVKAAAARAFALMKAGDSAGVHALFNAGMKKAVPQDKVAGVLEAIAAASGPLRDHEPIEVTGERGTFRLRAERGEWHLEVAVDQAGAISRMLVKPPAAPAAAEVPRSQLPLGLPFRGTWLVFWGGDTRERNYHVDTPSQRRAADLVVVDDDEKSFRGDGKANRDYFAYGQPVLAVADGKVVLVVDGIPDNTPGEMNPLLATGNLVVIEHGGGVHSGYAHLVPGSAKVKVGAAVKRGQLLGACGNSGNSSEPHLHFQLTDGPSLDQSLGIEPIFAGVEVTRDGARTRLADYTWRQGDRVHAP